MFVVLQCPLRRKIKPAYVPEYYRAQVQMLLEILDLELAHFVEYRPETTFSAKEFQVVEIQRDRGWFAAHFPCMRAFCDELFNTPDEKVREMASKATGASSSNQKSATVVTSPVSRVSETKWLGLNVVGQ